MGSTKTLPLERRTRVKKAPTQFARFQSELFHRVRASWRKPRGIDNRVRRRFRGNKLMPSIGYGSAKKTRHVEESGFRRFLVRSPHELEVLMMNNRKYAAELASSLSIRQRKALVRRAAALGVRVTNAHARLRAKEAQ